MRERRVAATLGDVARYEAKAVEETAQRAVAGIASQLADLRNDFWWSEYLKFDERGRAEFKAKSGNAALREYLNALEALMKISGDLPITQMRSTLWNERLRRLVTVPTPTNSAGSRPASKQ